MNVKSLLKLGLVTLAVVASGFLTACGGDATCMSLCEESQECDGAPKLDCTASCDLSAKINTASGCGALFDSAAVCNDSSADVCKPDNSCDTENKTYTDCVVKYCDENSDPEACKP